MARVNDDPGCACFHSAPAADAYTDGYPWPEALLETLWGLKNSFDPPGHFRK